MGAHMKPSFNTPRLLMELVAAVAVTEFGVVFLLPVVTPGVAGTAEAILHVALLALLAGPLIVWRLQCEIRRATGPVELGTGAGRGHATIAAGTLLTAGVGL